MLMGMPENITLRDDRDLPLEQVLRLYHSVFWSSAKKPEQLRLALQGSHTVITAWDGSLLVGLGSAISDGHLVVYYPHLLVLPDYQNKGIGRAIMEEMQKRYGNFHQQCLLADNHAVEFYKSCGFEVSGTAQGMWIFEDARREPGMDTLVS